ncbi:hypothetical protein AALP_AAs49363U000100 [Arabis alpina]|uniref:Uncharacterized protein n=1 Tax=Arabis alpina TaxID=50452 RepID=A0A087G1H6_ARAAL|nr:hypothetical protein AALP_AAs49363U000100 [Arabis alpina]
MLRFRIPPRLIIIVSHPSAPPLVDLPFREDLNRIRAGNHRWDDLSYTLVRLARDRLDIWNSEYWVAEMRGVTPGFLLVIQDSEDDTEGVSLPNQEETPSVKDGSQKIPSVTDAANIQRADDASARGSVLGESNELKGLGGVSRSKGKGKVNSVDKKAKTKRITAKAKADLEAGRILSFWNGGTCEVRLSEAPVSQSLGVTPPASLPVSSDSAAILSCRAVQAAVIVSQLPPPCASLTPMSRPASELSSESSLSKRRRTCQWTFSRVDPVMPFCNAAPRHNATLISLIGGDEINLPNPDKLSIFELLFFDWSSDIINAIHFSPWSSDFS